MARRKKSSNKDVDLAVSVNVAYKEVTLTAKKREKGYENVPSVIPSIDRR